MADDDSLRKLADRIQARAVRRMGELLKQVKPSKGSGASLPAIAIWVKRERSIIRATIDRRWIGRIAIVRIGRAV
jgi:hypothetical protein